MSDTTVDFGAPSGFGLHHFYVEIPAAPRSAISIFEDYGFDGDKQRRETIECRVQLARELWTQIRDEIRKDFNSRLKSKKQSNNLNKFSKIQKMTSSYAKILRI